MSIKSELLALLKTSRAALQEGLLRCHNGERPGSSCRRRRKGRGACMEAGKKNQAQFLLLGLLPFLGWSVLQELMSLLFLPVTAERPGLAPADRNALLMLASDGLALCLLVPFCRFLKRPSGQRPFTVRSAAGLAVLGLLLQGGIDSLLWLCRLLAPGRLAGYEDSMAGLGVGSPSLPVFLYIVCLAPVLEEYLFRGAVLGSWRKAFSFRTACVMQAALFGLAHKDPVQGFYAALLGLLLGAAAEKYGSLKAPLVLHVTINLAGYLTGLLRL